MSISLANGLPALRQQMTQDRASYIGTDHYPALPILATYSIRETRQFGFHNLRKKYVASFIALL